VVSGRGRLRRTFVDRPGQVLEKGQDKSTRNRQACMRYLMRVEEAKGVCKDRSKWKEVISSYPNGKLRDVMYVLMPVKLTKIFNGRLAQRSEYSPIAQEIAGSIHAQY
jgi:hypothetical protein